MHTSILLWGFKHNGINENLKNGFPVVICFLNLRTYNNQFLTFPYNFESSRWLFYFSDSRYSQIVSFHGLALRRPNIMKMLHKESAILWPLLNNLHYQWLQEASGKCVRNEVSGKYVRNEVTFWGVFCTHFFMKEDLALGPTPTEVQFLWLNCQMFIKFQERQNNY